MASSNIKLFDENKGNMLSDSEFSISNQRMNGLQTGIASSQLQNKAMYQASLVAYAIAQVMMQNGKNANDTDAVSAFVANLSGTMLQKVYDIATTAEAQAGVATGKWMSPALVKTAIDYVFGNLKATTSEAQAGTSDAKWMSPSKTKAFYDSKIAGSIEDSVPIGTVKFSIDNPDSSKYLLCNGVSLDSSAYPLLYSKLPEDFSTGWSLAKTLSLSGLQHVTGVRIVNGYTVILGKGSANVVYAYGTTLSNLTWVTTNVALSSGHDIGWDGSKYVIFAAGASKYYYASSLSSTSWTPVSTGINHSTGNVCRFVPEAKRFVVCGVDYGSTNTQNTLYVYVYDTRTNSTTASTTFTNNGWNENFPGVVGRYACFFNPRYRNGSWFITVDAVSSTISAVKTSTEVSGLCAKLDIGLAVFSGNTFFLFDTSGSLIRTVTVAGSFSAIDGSNITKIGGKYYISSYSDRSSSAHHFLCTEDFNTFEALSASDYACDVLSLDNELCYAGFTSGKVNIYKNAKTLPVITADKVHAYIKARN